MQSSKNAPNIGALIAFSHRLSCLITSEILREQSVKVIVLLSNLEPYGTLDNIVYCH